MFPYALDGAIVFFLHQKKASELYMILMVMRFHGLSILQYANMITVKSIIYSNTMRNLRLSQILCLIQ